MKKSGICPKCGSKEIYKGPEPGVWGRSYLSRAFLNSISLESFICKDCGFVEEYVIKKDLTNLDEKDKYSI